MADYDLGTARGKIVLDVDDRGTKSATDSLGKLGDSTSEVGEKAKKSFPLAENLIGAFNAAAIAAAGSVTAIGVAVIKSGLKRSVDIQVATTKMRGLGMTAEDVEVVMGNALTAVKGTAFGLGEAADLAATAVIAGIKPGVELERALKAATNAAAAMNVPLNEAGMIFQKVWSSGRVTMDEINQVTYRGLPILQLLADQYGVTAAEMRKMVGEGKVDVETFMQVVESSTGEIAKAMGDTLPGAMMNAQAALGRLGQKFMDPVVTNFPILLQAIGTAFDSLTKAIEPFAAAFGEKFTKLVTNAAEAIKKIDFTKINDDADRFNGIVATLSVTLGGALGALAPLLSKIPLVGGAFAGITGPIGLAIGAFVAMWTQSETLRDAVGKLFEVLGEVMKPLGPVLVVLAELVGKLAGAFGDFLGRAIESMLPALEAFATLMEPIGRLMAALFKAAEPLIPIFILLLEAALYPLISILEAITPLIEILAAGLTWLADQIEAWATSISGSTDEAGEGFSLFNEKGQTQIGEIIEWITTNWPKIVDTFTTVWETIVGIWDGIVAFFTPIVEGIIAAFTWMSEAVTNVWNTVSDAVQAFIDWWAANVQPPIDAVATAIQTAHQTMYDTVANIWNGLMIIIGEFVTWYETNVQPLIDAVTGLIGAAFGLLGEIISTIWDGVMVVVGAVVDWFQTYVQPIIDTVVGLISTAFSVMGDIIGNIWNGLMIVINAVVTWFQTYVQPVIDAFSNLVGAIFAYLGKVVAAVWEGIMAAVRVVVEWFQTYVQPVIDGVIKFVTDLFEKARKVTEVAWNNIREAVATVVQAVSDKINEVFGPIVEFVKGIFEDVKKNMEEPVNKAVDTIGGIKDKIMGFFSGAGDWLFNAGKDIIGGLISGIENMLGGLTGMLNGITNMIPKEKGPIEKDRVLLKPAGQQIITGLMAGISSQIPALVGMLNDLTATIPLNVTQSVGSAQLNPMLLGFDSPASSGDSTVINEFSGDIVIPIDDLKQLETLDEFLEMLRVYERQGGR